MGNFLNMTGKQNVFRNCVLIAVVINVFLNYVLIPKYGITGAAFATAFSMITWNIIAGTYVRLKYSINTFYFPGISRFLKG